MSVKRWVVLTLVLLVSLPALAASKSKDDRIAELEKRVAELQKTIEAQQAAYDRMLSERFADLSRKLDQQFSTLEQRIAAATQSAAEKDRLAGQLLADVNRQMTAGNFGEARQKMDELQGKFGDTNTARRARRLQQELAVFGKEAPDDLGIEKWYQGDGMTIDGDHTTLLVFWEEWCPHCQREVPKLEALYNKYREQGLQVVGLTKITRSATEEKVQNFIKQKKVTYPMAKEDGSATSYFAVSGIPAAAVVKDGKIVWRGHPARLTEQMLKDWL